MECLTCATPSWSAQDTERRDRQWRACIGLNRKHWKDGKCPTPCLDRGLNPGHGSQSRASEHDEPDREPLGIVPTLKALRDNANELQIGVPLMEIVS